MRRINHLDSKFLKFRVPCKGSTKHHLKPFPVSLCPCHRMNSYKSAPRFYITPESQALYIRIKDIVVGAWEYKEGIPFQVFLCHYRRVTGRVYFESILFAELLNTTYSTWYIIMHISFSIFCVNKHGYFFPFVPIAIGNDRLHFVLCIYTREKCKPDTCLSDRQGHWMEY